MSLMQLLTLNEAIMNIQVTTDNGVVTNNEFVRYYFLHTLNMSSDFGSFVLGLCSLCLSDWGIRG